VTDDYKFKWNDIDPDKLTEFLCDKHDFSRERVEATTNRLQKYKKSQKQKGLGEFF